MVYRSHTIDLTVNTITMSIVLRGFQTKIEQGCYDAWTQGAIDVMPIAPTGGGKTVIFSDIVRQYSQPSCAIAHRNELVGQIALALNRYDVPHSVIAPKETIKQIISLQMDDMGYSRYSPRAACKIAGVDTLIKHPHERWFDQVGLVVIDEGHHVLKENKWGRARSMFPNARGLYPTAHAIRADGRGLGRHADGLTDALVVGPCARDLINQGYLTDYELACPESDIDVSNVPVGESGEYVYAKLCEAVHKSSTIVGDVVKSYKKFRDGCLGITFAVDIKAATEITRAYRDAGVPAELITAKTPIPVRAALLRRLRKREILQLVNVDLFGEGFDLPAIEVVSMARHTASFQLYSQQFGRALRLMIDDRLHPVWDNYSVDERLAMIKASTKPKALIIDHVRNYQRHGLPDIPRIYSLDRRDKRSRSVAEDAIPLRACPQCELAYERVLSKCPYCTFAPLPQGRGSPAMVDGDMTLLDLNVLKQLRGEIARIDGAIYYPAGLNEAAKTNIFRRHTERYRRQQTLRDALTLWAGYQKHLGRDDPEIYRRFYFKFSVDMLTACTLNEADATELETRVRHQLSLDGVVKAA